MTEYIYRISEKKIHLLTVEEKEFTTQFQECEDCNSNEEHHRDGNPKVLQQTE